MLIWIEVALVMLGFGTPLEVKPCVTDEIAECRVIILDSNVTEVE